MSGRFAADVAVSGTVATPAANGRLRLSDARYEQRDGSEPQNLMKVRQGITAEKIDLPISLKELYEKKEY